MWTKLWNSILELLLLYGKKADLSNAPLYLSRSSLCSLHLTITEKNSLWMVGPTNWISFSDVTDVVLADASRTMRSFVVELEFLWWCDGEENTVFHFCLQFFKVINLFCYIHLTEGFDCYHVLRICIFEYVSVSFIICLLAS